MMKFRFVAAAAALLAGVTAVPATAKVFSFAGDFGNPVFSYGTVAANNAVTLFNPASCPGLTNCYRGSDQYQLVATLDPSTVLIHPGPNDAQNSVLFFTAPRTGIYTFSSTLKRGDTGDGVNVFTYNSGDAALTPVGRVDAANPTFSYTGAQAFEAGKTYGIGIDRGGAASTYFNDSTTLTGFISGAVPEPATWAMMIGGFGMIGFAMRRRNAVKSSVRFA